MISDLSYAGCPGAKSNLSTKKSGKKKNKIINDINFKFLFGKTKYLNSSFRNFKNFIKKKEKAHQINRKFLGNSLKREEAL